MMNPPPTAAAAIFFFFLFFKKNVHTDRVRVGQKKGRKKDAFFSEENVARSMRTILFFSNASPPPNMCARAAREKEMKRAGGLCGPKTGGAVFSSWMPYRVHSVFSFFPFKKEEGGKKIFGKANGLGHFKFSFGPKTVGQKN